MTDLDASLPRFVRDAFDSERDVDPALTHALDALPSLLHPLAVTNGSARLLAQVEKLPLRYAPFFDRLGNLWDMPEAAVVALMERAADARAWRKPGLPGMRVIDVTGGRGREGAAMHLVRFSPGMRYPAHRHTGPETLLVLEGSYEDDSGRVVGPGDLHEMPPDSAHRFKVGDGHPCVAASIHFGYEFTGAVMKVLVRFFG